MYKVCHLSIPDYLDNLLSQRVLNSPVTLSLCRQGLYYIYRDHELYAALKLLVLQHLLYGTNFQLMFNFRTVSLVLNRVLKRFYFELITVVRL